MNIKELRSLLDRAGAMLVGAGAKRASADLSKVRNILDGDDQQSVEAFVAETKALLSQPPLHELSAEEIAKRLRAIGTDESQFARLFAELKSKSLSKDKVIQVAALFTGGSSAWKSKNKALDAIRTRFEDDVYQASKMAQVDKVTPW